MSRCPIASATGARRRARATSAGLFVNKKGSGFFLNIVLGIVGAVVGGEIFTALGETRVTGFNLYSLVVSVIGAIIVLVIYHAIAGRREL